jgi:peptidoglycan hydrolase-like protein with peptidoglycan-binding domain
MVEVAEAARDVPLVSAMPPVLTAMESQVASAGDPPAERGRLDREEIVELQRRLNDLGFDSGPLDGVVGRLTRGAIRRYQEFAGLAPTGVADADILERLRQEARGVAASQ